jgi:hypothetical protein
MAHTFSAGVDPFGIAGDDLELVKVTEADDISHGVPSGGDGEYFPDAIQTYNPLTKITATYRAKVKTDITLEATLGGTAAALALESLKVTTANTKHAEVEASGHKHGATVHETNARTVSVTFAGWGATDFCADPANDGCQSGSWSASINHKDGLNKAGAFLCGRSQGTKVEVQASYISDTKPTLDADYTDAGSDIAKGEDFWTASLKGVLYMAPEVAP